MRMRLLLLILLLSAGFCLPVMAADRINVTDYGAIPNDGQDDTAAINSAINAGHSIYFPPGSYNYYSSIYVPANTSYRFYGDGPGVSTIVFTGNPYTGFYGYNMGSATLEIDGLTLKAGSKNCGTGIYALWNQAGANEKFRTAIIHNVQIIGSTRTGDTGTYWTGGIYLNRAQNAVIDNVEINGNAADKETGATTATQFGIVWTADGYTTTGLQLSNIEVYFCNTGLQVNGSVEGVSANGFEFAFCGLANGVPAVDLSSNLPNLGSAFHLLNGHVGLLQNGVRLTNLRDARISKLFVLHPGGNSSARSGEHVTLNNCTDAVISDSTFVGLEAITGYTNYTDDTCIRLNNSHSVQVIGNYFTRVRPSGNGIGIAIQSDSNLVRVVNNVFETDSAGYGRVKQPYSDAAPDTYYWGNSL